MTVIPATKTNFTTSDGWSFETSSSSGSYEKIERYSDRAVIYWGGNNSDTHYARIRRPVNLVKGDNFIMNMTMELPSDFYTKQESSVCFMRTDNYAVQPNNTWRIEFIIYRQSDQLPRLIIQREGISDREIWKGSQKLPTGRHDYKLVIHLHDVDGQAMTSLFVDNILWGKSTLANIPSGLTTNQKVITKLNYGADGAAAQDSKRISATLYKIEVLEDTSADPCALIERSLIDAQSLLGQYSTELSAAQLKYNNQVATVNTLTEQLATCRGTA